MTSISRARWRARHPVSCRAAGAPVAAPTMVLLVCLLLLLSALPIMAQPPAAEGEGAGEGNSRIDLSSPRAALRTFYEAMSGVQVGNLEREQEAIVTLEVDPALEAIERQQVALEKANRLFAILDQLQFSFEDVPEEASGRTVELELGKGNKVVPLRFYATEGEWRIAQSFLEAENLAAIEEQLAAATPPAPDTEGELPFVEDLRSPRAALQLFIRAMRSEDGLTPDDAVRVLDQANLPPDAQLARGERLAFFIKQTLDRTRLIEFSEVPPTSVGPPYFVLRDPAGNLVLDIVRDEDTGERAWRFTPESLEVAPDLYDKYRDQPALRGVESPNAEQVPLDVRVRNVLYDSLPVMRERWFMLQNGQWVGLFVIIFLGMVISRIVAALILLAVHRWFRANRYELDDNLGIQFVRPIRIALMAWFWLLALVWLNLPADILYVLRLAAETITVLAAVWAIYKLVDILGGYLQQRATNTQNRFDDLLVPLITKTLKFLVLAGAIIFVAERYDFNVQTLLATLGLGGLAFALAAQDTIGNVFGSVTVVFDRPFRAGDWIKIDDVEGGVERVGIRSTRIRTFYNSLVIVPNAKLLSATIDNMGARRYRRLTQTLSLTYDTPPERIEAFCEGVRELIRQHPYTRKDYYHVYFNAYGAASLDIMLYCFFETPDWPTELRERHRLLLDILRLAKIVGVEFAFPTQTLYLRQEDTPSHDTQDKPRTARRLGVEAAEGIVRQHLGPQGFVPPPVVIGAESTELKAGFDDEEEEE